MKGKKSRKVIRKLKKVKKVGKVVRISTGIKELDNVIQGGFKKNSINLVVGGAGSGKTIFAIQFLIEGVKRGEPGVYITFEEKREELYEDMLAFGWDLERYEKEKKLMIVEYTPEQVKKILTEGGGTIEALISNSKAKRLVIDSISSFGLLYQDELTKKEATLALFDLIRRWGLTALLTSEEEDAEKGDDVPGIEFEVDGIIILYHIKHKGERVRALEILKMRGTKHPAQTFPLEIANIGIRINTRKIIEF